MPANYAAEFHYRLNEIRQSQDEAKRQKRSRKAARTAQLQSKNLFNKTLSISEATPKALTPDEVQPEEARALDDGTQDVPGFALKQLSVTSLTKSQEGAPIPTACEPEEYEESPRDFFRYFSLFTLNFLTFSEASQKCSSLFWIICQHTDSEKSKKRGHNPVPVTGRSSPSMTFLGIGTKRDIFLEKPEPNGSKIIF